jgi:hypothetical protein
MGSILRRIAAGVILLAEAVVLADFSYSAVGAGNVAPAVGVGIIGAIAMTISVGLFGRRRWAVVAGGIWADAAWALSSLILVFSLLAERRRPDLG